MRTVMIAGIVALGVALLAGCERGTREEKSSSQEKADGALPLQERDTEPFRERAWLVRDLTGDHKEQFWRAISYLRKRGGLSFYFAPSPQDKGIASTKAELKAIAGDYLQRLKDHDPAEVDHFVVGYLEFVENWSPVSME
jgi:hypothetical protein